MEQTYDSFLRFARDARERLMPRLASSHFNDLGILTAEEFVLAGDNLVLKYPQWQWASTKDPSMRKSYLPQAKQYLLLRGAPCLHRVNELLPEEDTDSDWHAVDSLKADPSACTSKGDEHEYEQVSSSLFLANLDPAGASKTGDITSSSREDSESKDATEALQAIFDLEDPSVFSDFTSFDAHSLSASREGSGFVKARKYDLSLAYDNYYRVPRVFLFGYDENGSALSHTQMMRDVMSDYARKTVTIEPHPHLSTPMLSIHPCKHGHAMLQLIRSQRACGLSPSVDGYLFLFLKFIQSVVPTIEYDHTLDCLVR